MKILPVSFTLLSFCVWKLALESIVKEKSSAKTMAKMMLMITNELSLCPSHHRLTGSAQETPHTTSVAVHTGV